MIHDFNIQFSTQKLLEDIDETSTTSGAGAYLPKAGYKKKEGERTEGGMIYKDLWNEGDTNESLEIGDRVKVTYGNEFYGYTGTIDDIVRGFVVVDVDGEGLHSMHISDVQKIEDEEEEDEDLDEVFATQEKDRVKQLLDKLKQIDYNAYRKLLMAIIDPKPYTYADAETELGGKLGLSENYSRFKNETKTRNKSEQFHQAIREVKKRVHEIHRVFEYVNRLKEELSEGEDGLKYKKHTEEAVSKIKDMVSELNTKIKKFK